MGSTLNSYILPTFTKLGTCTSPFPAMLPSKPLVVIAGGKETCQRESHSHSFLPEGTMN